ncbi:anti-sigma factor [Streptomyces sp. J2-1]|uniref:anti-sigma factor n=1 Tax=Streptomyces corallincola TaxID=2851888 RepID=UPI001C38181D|nr:anti-sigma factor [Streptomyces corallincola]MBV2356204.1 anti-sigma factor [Streptomyces corallincola]
MSVLDRILGRDTVHAPDALELRERRRRGRHLGGCPRCADDVRLGRGPDRAAGGAEPRWALLMPFATVTAAAALVVAALFAVQQRDTRGRLDGAEARAREIAHVLAAPDARAASRTDARGRGIGVVASAARGRAVVTLSGYGTLSGGLTHQLWLTHPHARPRSLGLLSGDTPLVAGGIDRAATSLAVTVEPDGGSAQPTSQAIVQLTLKSVGFGE